MNLPDVKKSLDSLNDFSQDISKYVDGLIERSEKIYDLVYEANKTLIGLHEWLYRGGGRETYAALEGYVAEIAGALNDFGNQDDKMDDVITDMMNLAFRLENVMGRVQKFQRRDFKKG